MEKNIVIGIEGLVGAGKTAICRELLNKIPNSILLQGGNLYRAVAYSLMQSGLSLEELRKNMQQVDIRSMMEQLKIEFKIEDRDTTIYVAGKKMEEENLQSTSASLAVSEISKVANHQNLFLFGKQVIDHFREKYNVIVSGRALMQIYPSLDYHFLITASFEERIRRKSIQYQGKVSKEELKQNILKRDELQEKAGFYQQYEKTIMVDVTNCQTVQESASKVLQYISLKKGE